MSPTTLYPLERVFERIIDAENRLGHSLGWRLLMDRQCTYAADTPYAFITPLQLPAKRLGGPAAEADVLGGGPRGSAFV